VKQDNGVPSTSGDDMKTDLAGVNVAVREFIHVREPSQSENY
jgi:hypothetical protein